MASRPSHWNGGNCGFDRACRRVVDSSLDSESSSEVPSSGGRLNARGAAVTPPLPSVQNDSVPQLARF